MTRSTRPLALTLTALVTVGLTLTACSDDKEDAAKNEEKACTAIGDLQSAVAGVSGLTAASTLEEIRAVREDVREAYDELADSLDDVARDRQAALKETHEAFNDSVDDLPDDATLPDAIAALQEEATAIQSAQTAVSDDLSCD